LAAEVRRKARRAARETSSTAKPPPSDRRQRAQHFLRDQLARGAKQASVVEDAAAKAHIDEQALGQARADLGIVTSRANTGGGARRGSGACQAEADFGLRRGLGARQRSLASRFRFYARRRASARCRRNLRIRLRAGCHYAELLACGGIYAGCPSSRIDKYRGTMRFREERIDFAPLPVECQRMCACFRWHHLLAAHRGNIDDIYYPRVADGHVKVLRGLRM